MRTLHFTDAQMISHHESQRCHRFRFFDDVDASMWVIILIHLDNMQNTITIVYTRCFLTDRSQDCGVLGDLRCLMTLEHGLFFKIIMAGSMWSLATSEISILQRSCRPLPGPELGFILGAWWCLSISGPKPRTF